MERLVRLWGDRRLFRGGSFRFFDSLLVILVVAGLVILIFAFLPIFHLCLLLVFTGLRLESRGEGLRSRRERSWSLRRFGGFGSVALGNGAAGCGRCGRSFVRRCDGCCIVYSCRFLECSRLSGGGISRVVISFVHDLGAMVAGDDIVIVRLEEVAE